MMIRHYFTILLVGLLVCGYQVLNASAKKECGLFDLKEFKEKSGDYMRRKVANLASSNSTIKKKTTSRIFGGWKQKDTLSFPSIANVMIKSKDDFEHDCGGTLIDEWHVLTSASCVQHHSEPTSGEAGMLSSWIDVTLGTVEYIKAKKRSVKLPAARHRVEKVIAHADYNGKTLENDIAVLKLKEKVTLSKWIQPACLPEAKSNSYPEKPQAQVLGWGKTKSNKQNTPLEYFLRSVTIDINASGIKCKKTGGNRVKDFDAQICAGGNRKRGDTCDGDQGGPLYVTEKRQDERQVLAGITSYNEAKNKCGNKNV
jgi:secreted trypsin-like serine protease